MPRGALLGHRDMAVGVQTLCLWIVVLIANLAGAHLGDWTLANTHIFPPEVQNAFAEIGREAASVTPGTGCVDASLGVRWSHRHHRHSYLCSRAEPVYARDRRLYRSLISGDERRQRLGPLGHRLLFTCAAWQYSGRRLTGLVLNHAQVVSGRLTIICSSQSSNQGATCIRNATGHVQWVGAQYVKELWFTGITSRNSACTC
jgi:hypothetical protein